MRVRRYKVRYGVHGVNGGDYATTVREFTSLRAVGEFAQDLPSDHEFLDIRAVQYETLTPQECEALAVFSGGRVKLTPGLRKFTVHP